MPLVPEATAHGAGWASVATQRHEDHVGSLPYYANKLRTL